MIALNCLLLLVLVRGEDHWPHEQRRVKRDLYPYDPMCKDRFPVLQLSMRARKMYDAIVSYHPRGCDAVADNIVSIRESLYHYDTAINSSAMLDALLGVGSNDERILEGVHVIPKSRCVSVLNKYNFESRVCPISVSCGVYHNYIAENFWFSVTYVCIPHRRFTDTSIRTIGARTLFPPDVPSSLSRSTMHVAHDVIHNKFAIIPGRCAPDVILRGVAFPQHKFTTDSVEQKVCLNFTYDDISSLCTDPVWVTPEVLNRILLGTIEPLLLDTSVFRATLSLQPIDQGVMSDCTLREFVSGADCFTFADSSVLFRRYAVTRCYSIHYNAHNWFTALVLTMLHALLDPLFELVQALLVEAFAILTKFVQSIMVVRVGGMSLGTYMVASMVAAFVLFRELRSWTLTFIALIVATVLLIETN